MRRREFITLLGGAVLAWPTAARAQQAERIRRIGALIAAIEDDPEFRRAMAAFREGLAKGGWIEGRNLRLDARFVVGDPDRIHAHATELVGLAPDVMFVTSTAAIRAVQRLTQTLPIVFAGGGDPIANDMVQNLARPEGNTTGFSNRFLSISGKWLELLKEAAPRIARVALLYHPDLTAGSVFASIEAAAPVLSLATVRIPVRNALETVRAVDAFAAVPNGSLLLLPPTPTLTNLELIIQLAAQHQMPTIGSGRIFTVTGGLMAYESDVTERYRGAATYIDRIMRGTKVSDLPVQFPTKFELIINLKTAKTIGLNVSPTLLARADEVIE